VFLVVEAPGCGRECWGVPLWCLVPTAVSSLMPILPSSIPSQLLAERRLATLCQQTDRPFDSSQNGGMRPARVRVSTSGPLIMSLQ